MHDVRWQRTAVVAVALAASLAAMGCGREEAPAPAPAASKAAPGPSLEARQEARALFETECAPCHGVGGAANGVRSEGLVPQPRNFQDPEWQRSVSDDYLERVIVEGGAAVGKSDVMPGYPALREKPEVVSALRLHLRSFSE